MLNRYRREFIITMEVDLEKAGNLEESISELARNEIDSLTSSNKNVSDNKIDTHLNSNCAPTVEKQNHNEGNLRVFQLFITFLFFKQFI